MGYGWWLQLAGPAVGFVGGLLLVIAQQPVAGRVAGFVSAADGQIRAFVVLRFPRTWWVGLVLLCLGFILQVAGQIMGAYR